jgi:cell wall-associated NlpC family hydrolase
MTPVFQSAERQAALLVEARSWLGTPFVPRGNLKGVGVDCVHLPAEIYRALGVLPSYGFPDYNLDSGSHADRSLVTGWLDGRADFLPLAPVEACLAGDLLAFRIGKVVHHVGLLLGQTRFIHCLRHRGVLESDLRDPTYAKRLVRAYRPLQ